MDKLVTFHEDAFYDYFKPVRHPEALYNIWGGHGLETFGNDWKVVRCHDSEYVWTVVDGGYSPDQWIHPGVHYINRVCYIITEIPHNWIDIEFRIHGRPSSLTELGLKRQITRLRKAMASPSLKAA